VNKNRRLLVSLKVDMSETLKKKAKQKQNKNKKKKFG